MAAVLLLGGCTSSAPRPATPTSASTSALGAPPPPNTTLTPLATCDASGLRLNLVVSGETGTAGIGLIVLSPKAPCRVATNATLTLVDDAGKPLDVHGNPATASLDGVAGRTEQDSQFANSFDWQNWCGPRTPSPRLEVRLPAFGLESTVTPSSLPRCDLPGSASTLATIPS